MVTTISYDPRTNQYQIGTNQNQQHGVAVEDIQGLIKVYNDGHVERLPIVPNVTPDNLPSELCITARDVILHRSTNLWARVYVPMQQRKLPFVVYFHGGGFCVGSAAWKCYHDFLAHLASKACCVIMSVNYRLAPENRLPAAYEDGVNTITWVKQQSIIRPNEHNWWLNHSNFSSFFLAGDSAGANIAHHVATTMVTSNNNTLNFNNLSPLFLKGIVLIQPFFGGETRTHSEKNSIQLYNSALTLSASDAYWRLSLPVGANRDHPWCNALAKSSQRLITDMRLPQTMVCVSEMDILKDRNMDFCGALASSGTKVEKVIYKGVGHAFQILHNYSHSQQRLHEMMSHIQAFIHP